VVPVVSDEVIPPATVYEKLKPMRAAWYEKQGAARDVLVVNSIWGVRWADPLAALVLLPVIVREGWEAIEGKPCCGAG
jgi:hypothetical protein